MQRELHDSLRAGLAALQVPSRMIQDALELTGGPLEAVLVYGSRARGDSVSTSDLDLLALVGESRRTVHRGDVSLSCYTREQLRTGVGTLFGAHLKRDAVVVWDPAGALAASVDSMGEVDVPRLFDRVAELSVVLGSRGYDVPKYLSGLLREARYLVRSCLYAQAIAESRPCFSVRELALRHQDPDLARLLASRPVDEAAIEDLRGLCFRLEGMIGPLRPNRHGSLEALIVNEWSTDSDLLAMAMLALGGSNTELDYVEVRKVLL